MELPIKSLVIKSKSEEKEKRNLEKKYLHSGPSIRIDFADLVPDLLREEACTPFFLVAKHASLSQSTGVRE